LTPFATVKGVADMVFFNLVVDGNHNVISGNEVGPRLPDGRLSCGCYGVSLREGADDNLVFANRAEAADVGLLAEVNTFRNVLRGNSAVSYSVGEGLHAKDMSGSCVNNTWVENGFETKDPACIR
jgi:hypothetical protein